MSNHQNPKKSKKPFNTSSGTSDSWHPSGTNPRMSIYKKLSGDMYVVSLKAPNNLNTTSNQIGASSSN